MVDAGGVAVEILETNVFREPTQAELDTWIDTFGLTITSVIDRDPDAQTETFTALGVREQIFIVDLSTMTIVYQFSGDVTGQATPSANAAIDDILSRLGR